MEKVFIVFTVIVFGCFMTGCRQEKAPGLDKLNSKSRFIRSTAIRYYGKKSSPSNEVVSAFIKVLLIKNLSWQNWEETVKFLIKSGGRSGKVAVLRALDNEQGECHWDSLKSSISPYNAELDTVMQEQFYLISKDGKKCIGYIYALWGKQGVNSLALLLKADGDGRKILLESLGKTGSDKAIPILGKYLDSNTCEAARALVAIGPASAEVLKKKSTTLPDCALGYGKVSGPQGFEHLAKLLHNSSSEVVRYAILGLGYTKSDKATQLLIEQYPNFKGMTRAALVNSLYRLGKKESIPVFRQAINDKNPCVRIAAIYAFMNVDRAVGENLIVEKLKDPVLIVVRIAAWSVGHLATPKAVPSLIYLVNESKDKYTLRAVAFALSKIIKNLNISPEVQDKCRQALVKLSKHEWHEVRTHANNGLKNTN